MTYPDELLKQIIDLTPHGDKMGSATVLSFLRPALQDYVKRRNRVVQIAELEADRVATEAPPKANHVTGLVRKDGLL
jgi:hypothetical protein